MAFFIMCTLAPVLHHLDGGLDAAGTLLLGRLEVGIRNLVEQLYALMHVRRRVMTVGLSGCDPRSVYDE